MTVRINKPAFNIREKLKELDFFRLPFQKMPPGSIIQVESTYDTDHIRSSTSVAYVDIMEATITPRRSNSKILVIVTLSVSKVNNFSFLGRVLRNGTPFAGGDSAALNSTDQATWEDNVWFNIRNTVYSATQYTQQYLDSPSTTSAVTYKVQGKTTGSGAGEEFAVNVPSTEVDHPYGSPTFSNITLMEIAQ